MVRMKKVLTNHWKSLVFSAYEFLCWLAQKLFLSTRTKSLFFSKTKRDHFFPYAKMGGFLGQVKQKIKTMSDVSGNKNDVALFFINLMMGGVSAAISKIASAPIECAALLLQIPCQCTLYERIGCCLKRTIVEQGFIFLWRGNLANVLHYFPSQALNFAFKDQFRRMFGYNKVNLVFEITFSFVTTPVFQFLFWKCWNVVRILMDTGSVSLATLPVVVQLVLLRCSSRTP